MTVIALIGAQALWLTYLWLASAILACLSERKGYGERVGLARAAAERHWRGRVAGVPPAPRFAVEEGFGPWGRGQVGLRQLLGRSALRVPAGRWGPGPTRRVSALLSPARGVTLHQTMAPRL